MARFHKKTDKNGLDFNAVQHLLVPATDIMKKELLLSSIRTAYSIYDNGKLLGEPIALDKNLREFMVSIGYRLEPRISAVTRGKCEICGIAVTIDKGVKGKIHIKFSGADAVDSREKFVVIANYLRKCDPSIKGRCRGSESTKPNTNCKTGKV